MRSSTAASLVGAAVLGAFLGVPIMSGDEILGALYLANKPGGYTESDEELVGVLAAHAAIALTHARLYARNRELTIAEERARTLTSEQEIVKRSQQRAVEILTAAQTQAKELSRNATVYCEGILKNSEEVLARSVADIKNTRMNLRNAARPNRGQK